MIGRAELFTKNFFDPTATAFDRRERGVRGGLPNGTAESLRSAATELATSGDMAALVSAIIETMPAYLLQDLTIPEDEMNRTGGFER